MTVVFPAPAHLWTALLLAIAISSAARAVRALSWSGFFAAIAVGFALFGFAGFPGAAALLTFFISSSALSRIGKKRKDALRYEKGGERDAGQVLANGGVAAVAALGIPFLGPDTRWIYCAVLGALAAANADTWATEIGSLARGKPRRITDFRPVATGESGAVSLPGTLAALLGATVIALLVPLRFPGFQGISAVAVAGFAGSLLDSYLGATVQEQYRDPSTGRLTERRTAEDGTPLAHFRGVHGLGNDAVNFFCTLFGGTLSALFSI
ncbi:MAG: DUF92 domain-containing protein [Capsulimonadales bacterium]|nr:DUF92 domain-containing protein [Capsulimonadales bacterium]